MGQKHATPQPDQQQEDRVQKLHKILCEIHRIRGAFFIKDKQVCG
jgi:hypothetical protein